jgi:hypothetical protein
MGPLAQFIIMNGRAKLTYLENGELTETLLAGTSDPTVLEGHANYELLHFNLSKLGPASVAPHLYSLSVYLKTSPYISLMDCVLILDQLSHLFGIRDLAIFVRTDAWFLEDIHYPAVLAFRSLTPLPSQPQYASAPYVTCTLASGKATCSGFSFRP